MRVCPQCSQVSQDSTAYCIRCGYRFLGNEQTVNEETTIRQPGPVSLANFPPNTDPAATLTQAGQQRPAASQSQAPVATASSSPQQPTPASLSSSSPQQPTPAANAQEANSASSYTIPTPTPTPGFSPAGPAPDPKAVQSGYMLPPQHQQQGVYPPAAYGQPPYAAPSAGGGLSSLQRAFAGKGTPVHHSSWLLDGKQVPAATLRNSLVEQIQKQGVMGVTAAPERLSEQGIILENRDFVKVQYGASSVFVYMAPMGQNLYVSRISTIQQPVSRIRAVVAVSLLILLLICLLFYALLGTAFSDPASSIRTFFSYAFYGLLFFFLFALLRSVVFWLSENDFLALLRPNQLNDFSLDTLSSIEQITDKGIRETLKQAGLNAEEISKPAQSYAPQQPFHRI